MKLLGHRTANMTLRYVEITQKDLQREFHLARLTPRHLIPLPPDAVAPGPDDTGTPAVLRHLSATIRALDLFRQNNAAHDKLLRLLLRRLARISTLFKKTFLDAKTEK
jgi:hypothetical protein